MHSPMDRPLTENERRAWQLYLDETPPGERVASWHALPEIRRDFYGLAVLSEILERALGPDEGKLSEA